MTHGVGSISTGGGGGFSGGGFSSTGFNAGVFAGAASSSSRRRNNNNDTDGGECCCLFCSLILFFTCLMKMKTRTRIILTWFYVILGAVLAIVLTLRHNASAEVPISPSDMKILNQPSTMFCQRAQLDCSSLIDYYVMKNEPSIDESKVVNYTENVYGNIERNTYEYWGFYLLKGSKVKMSYAISDSIGFYIFKGDDGFNKWKKDARCNNCYWTQRYLFYSGTTGEYNITETDQYYFLFSYDNQFVFPSVNVDVTFHLSRTRYVLDDVNIRCPNNFDCTVDLYGESRVIVVRMPEHSSFDSPVNVYCRPRVYMYFLLYALAPCVVGICVTVAICIFARKKNSTQRDRRGSTVHIVSNDDRLSGFANESGQHGLSYPSDAVIRPPNYSAAQKVVQSNSGAPPSYEQATKKEHV
ncbi:uncharacterized protein LOC127834358 [Dreissena polymorpha]|uniref:Uncharacterized protein n=1 Tax=Dreissena polymorpha TaxID=45954 RepID=A0A9D4GF60_DREPO|nr:uncharacterized protein LOC127834358 [Dreissena polymorpha]KAH3813855.1 hypothetical protein DPMN_142325 [Dreissena polymorpha]